MRRLVPVSLLVMLVASPFAVAGWSGKGTYEPDTRQDAADGWMQVDPDWTPTTLPTPVRKVYFNGFFGQCTFPCYLPVSSANPNAGNPLIRSAAMSTLTLPYAMLGVWKDCNRDGYIGLGDQGLWEYRAEVIAFDPSVCKPTPTPIDPLSGRPPIDWIPEHNDGQWVHEFIPFARNDAAAGRFGDPNPWNLNDSGSRVWADPGLPGQAVSGGGCAGNPQPKGTFRSVGGLIEFTDCHFEWRITDGWNSAVATIGGDDLGVGQVSFADKPRDQSESASILNVKHPYGTDSDASFVEVWDCSQPQLASVPIREGTVYVNVSSPRVVPGVGIGSPAGTANSTMSGFDECARTTSNDDAGPLFGLVLGGHWHPGHYFANAPYVLVWPVGEADFQNAAYKVSPASIMAPHPSNRPAAPWGAILGKGAPPNLGAMLAGWEDFWSGGGINPGNAFVDATGGDVLPVTYWTFYAYVSDAAISKYGLTLPKGSSSAAYGAEACEGQSSGVRNGWDCDPARWGTDPKIGSLYRLRDIDCIDSSVKAARDVGVSWGTLTGTACDATP